MSSNHAPLSASRWASLSYQENATLHNSYLQPHRQPSHLVPMGGNCISRFDPPGSNFEPNGAEVQCYHSQADMMTPSSTEPKASGQVSPDIAQIQQFIMANHFDHTKEMATLERKTQYAKEQIQQVRDMLGHDLPKLQGEIEDLKQGIRDRFDQDGMLVRQSRSNGIGPPKAEALRNFSRHEIAKGFMDEADGYAKAASKLRDQAREMSAEVATERLVKLQLVEDPDGEGQGGGVTKVEFACCRNVFDTIGNLLDHVQATHGRPNGSAVGASARTSIESSAAERNTTPTHVPLRRSKVEKETTSVEANEQDKVREMIQATCATTPRHPRSITQDVEVVGEITQVQQQHNDSAQAVEIAPATPWKPLAVRNMPPATFVNELSNPQTFTWEYLQVTLGGTQWSPGFYFVPDTCQTDLPSRSYWILEAEYEPFLPATPGEHGAKLTAFFNSTVSFRGQAPDEENFHRVPVFVRVEGSSEYMYFGNYSQLRFSDKLEYDRVLETVPEKVRQYWADQLSARGRPEWVTECLREHFWPKPVYGGPVPSDSALSSAVLSEGGEETSQGKNSVSLNKKVQRAVDEYLAELREWKKETDMKVSILSAEALMQSFSGADADEEPGLRLWWEYLECVGYDQGFYDYLVKIKCNPGLQRKPVAIRGNLTVGRGNPTVGRGNPTVGRGNPTVGKARVEKVHGVENKSNGAENMTRPTVSGKIVAPGPKSIETVRAALAGPSSSKSKPHTSSTIKPWDMDGTRVEAKKASNRSKTSSKGDLELAKQMQKGFTKAKPRRGSGGPSNGRNGGVYTPPHLRPSVVKHMNLD